MKKVYVRKTDVKPLYKIKLETVDVYSHHYDRELQIPLRFNDPYLALSVANQLFPNIEHVISQTITPINWQGHTDGRIMTLSQIAELIEKDHNNIYGVLPLETVRQMPQITEKVITTPDSRLQTPNSRLQREKARKLGS